MDESLRIGTVTGHALLLSAVIQVPYPFKEDFHFKGVPFPPRSAPSPRMEDRPRAFFVCSKSVWSPLSRPPPALNNAECRQAYYVSTLDEGGGVLFSLPSASFRII